MNIETVNELIASLESAGELSIREQKFLKLAKAFKQVVGENVALKGALTGSAYISFIKANGWNTSASTVNGKFVNFADPEVDFGSMVFAHAKKLIEAVETPATDAHLAGIKADAITASLDACSDYLETDCVMDRLDISYEEAEKRTSGAMEFHDSIVAFAQQLREGAK
ncbi:hypothetical protein [Klebsiella variicola]|uniref:hypothetical protein n=1 Tax=Klebsiella variicola TaxID=244366 RepID=UPI001F23403B|nr:hypothetical protein [Klebsiella variicola]